MHRQRSLARELIAWLLTAFSALRWPGARRVWIRCRRSGASRGATSLMATLKGRPTRVALLFGPGVNGPAEPGVYPLTAFPVIMMKAGALAAGLLPGRNR
jgi:hypothetical protein